MQLSKAVEGYIISSLAEGYSPLTLNAYKSALFTMIEYPGDQAAEKVLAYFQDDSPSVRAMLHFTLSFQQNTQL